MAGTFASLQAPQSFGNKPPFPIAQSRSWKVRLIHYLGLGRSWLMAVILKVGGVLLLFCNLELTDCLIKHLPAGHFHWWSISETECEMDTKSQSCWRINIKHQKKSPEQSTPGTLLTQQLCRYWGGEQTKLSFCYVIMAIFPMDGSRLAS